MERAAELWLVSRKPQGPSKCISLPLASQKWLRGRSQEVASDQLRRILIVQRTVRGWLGARRHAPISPTEAEMSAVRDVAKGAAYHHRGGNPSGDSEDAVRGMHDYVRRCVFVIAIVCIFRISEALFCVFSGKTHLVLYFGVRIRTICWGSLEIGFESD